MSVVWYQLTWVVLDKGPLNVCVCVCVCVCACVCVTVCDCVSSPLIWKLILMQCDYVSSPLIWKLILMQCLKRMICCRM